jgi:hypothetical protein
MRFNKHSEIEGKHSFLTPSSPAWLRYDDHKLERRYMEHLAAQRGTEEHDFAARAIKLGHRMPEEPRTTLSMYINDSIGWRMKPEVPLYWSPHCFGHADALGLNEKLKVLRVSDLKTGRVAVKFDQLVIYAAIFCLEYEYNKPWELDFELRIYQGNAIKLHEPEPDEIVHAMDRILTGTRLLEAIYNEQRA